MLGPFLPPAASPARRGAVIVYTLVFLILAREVADVALALMSDVEPNWGSAVRIIVTLGLAYGLFRGFMWARMLLIVVGMVAFAFVLAAIMSHPWDGISTFAILVAAVYLAIVVVLAFSPAVRAYEAWRQELRTPTAAR